MMGLEFNGSFTEEEASEIKRVNSITRPGFTKALVAMISGRRSKISPILRAAFDEVYNGVEVNLEGQLPDVPCVIVANHPTHSLAHRLIPGYGYAPPTYLMVNDSFFRQELGQPFRFITRETKPVNALIDELGYIRVDAKNPNISRINAEVQALLSQGDSVCVCPEGNFYGQKENNDLDVVGPFQRGFYHFAKAQDGRESRPVVPVSLKGFNRAGSKDFSLSFGEALRTEDFDSAQTMATYVREEVFGRKFGFELVDKRAV